MHGALTSSNIGLDGRWLDFGCMGLLAQQDKKLLINEERYLVKSIADILFYAFKYLKIKDVLKETVALQTLFYQHYNFLLSRQFIIQAGFPVVLVDKLIRKEKVKELASRMVMLFQAEKEETPKILPFDAEDNFAIGMYVLASYHDEEEICLNLLRLCFNTSHDWNRRFISLYKAVLVDMQKEAFGISSQSLRRAIIINTARFAKECRHFLRVVMVSEIQEIIGGNAESLTNALQRYLETSCQLAKLHFFDHQMFQVLCWIEDNVQIVFDMQQNYFLKIKEGKAEVFTDEDLLSCNNKGKLVFGQLFWEKLLS
jgi:hypothetical protein